MAGVTVGTGAAPWSVVPQASISDHGHFAVTPVTCASSFEAPGYHHHYGPALFFENHYLQQQQHELQHVHYQQQVQYQQQQQQQAAQFFASQRLVQDRERWGLRERRGRQGAVRKAKKLRAKLNVLKEAHDLVQQRLHQTQTAHEDLQRLVTVLLAKNKALQDEQASKGSDAALPAEEPMQEPAGSHAVPSVVTAQEGEARPSGLAGQERWLADRPGAMKDSFVEGLREAEATAPAIDVATNGLGADMVFIEQLGAGTFGEIHKVSYQGRDYAAKLAKEGIPQAAISQRIEAMVLKRVVESIDEDDEECVRRAEHVVRLVALDDTSPKMPFLLELAQGDLWEIVCENSKMGLTFDQILRAAIDMTVGLEFIHDMGVVHCDIKPGNVLLTRKPDGDIVAKIADLGEAKGIGEFRRCLTGTLGYIPLECFDDGTARKEADFFAAGVVAVMLLLKRNLRYSNLFFCPEASNAEDVAAVNQLCEAGQQHGPAMDAIEPAVTHRNLESDAVRVKLMVPANIRDEVPMAVRDWMCEAFGPSLKPDPADRLRLPQLRDCLEELRTKAVTSAPAPTGPPHASGTPPISSPDLPETVTDKHDDEDLAASAVSPRGGMVSKGAIDANDTRLDLVSPMQDNTQRLVIPPVTPPAFVLHHLGSDPSVLVLEQNSNPTCDNHSKYSGFPFVTRPKSEPAGATRFRCKMELDADTPVSSSDSPKPVVPEILREAYGRWYCPSMRNRPPRAVDDRSGDAVLATADAAILPLSPATSVAVTGAQSLDICEDNPDHDMSSLSETESLRVADWMSTTSRCGEIRGAVSHSSLGSGGKDGEDGASTKLSSDQLQGSSRGDGNMPRWDTGSKGSTTVATIPQSTRSTECGSIPCQSPPGLAQSGPLLDPVIQIGPPLDLALSVTPPPGFGPPSSTTGVDPQVSPSSPELAQSDPPSVAAMPIDPSAALALSVPPPPGFGPPSGLCGVAPRSLSPSPELAQSDRPPVIAMPVGMPLSVALPVRPPSGSCPHSGAHGVAPDASLPAPQVVQSNPPPNPAMPDGPPRDLAPSVRPPPGFRPTSGPHGTARDPPSPGLTSPTRGPSVE